MNLLDIRKHHFNYTRHFEYVQVNDEIIDDLCFSFIKELQEYDEDEKFIFFYHKDHLGSSTQISNRDAKIIHHIEYMPSGEQFSEQRDSWATPYKFNSKELDAETGLYYYGARYYTPEIGIWLSVDPLSDKYPSMSAYMYCAGNPVILVDPDGREIWIIGDQASVAFNSMQQGTNLQLKMEDGKISHIGGEALNDNDAKLLEAIKSTKVNVQIETTIGVEHGEYHGTTYDESNQTAESTQRVNIYGLKGLEKPGAEGSGIIHEATEGYQMGLLSIEKKDNIHRAGFTIEQQSVGAGNNQGSIPNEIPENPADYKLYEIGHGRATKAPDEMRRKEAINYKNPK